MCQDDNVLTDTLGLVVPLLKGSRKETPAETQFDAQAAGCSVQLQLLQIRLIGKA